MPAYHNSILISKVLEAQSRSSQGHLSPASLTRPFKQWWGRLSDGVILKIRASFGRRLRDAWHSSLISSWVELCSGLQAPDGTHRTLPALTSAAADGRPGFGLHPSAVWCICDWRTVQNRGEQAGWVGSWELICGNFSEYKCREPISNVKGTVLQRENTVERVNWRECGSPRLQGFRVKEKRLLWLTRILLRRKRIRPR